jgi:UDP-3-O-[3-hydroxymyristoyl] glucosamine N-acyltransferase
MMSCAADLAMALAQGGPRSGDFAHLDCGSMAIPTRAAHSALALCSAKRHTGARMSREDIHIDPTAEVRPEARIGNGSKIWNWTKVRENTRIGPNRVIGQCIHIDSGVEIGNASKVQNNVSVDHRVTLGRAVFVGPNVTFTNDRFPRTESVERKVVATVVEDGASIGGNANIRRGLRRGSCYMMGAGAVVTLDGRPLHHGMAGPTPDPARPASKG